MLTTALTLEQLEYANTIEASSNHLLNIVNDILGQQKQHAYNSSNGNRKTAR